MTATSPYLRATGELGPDLGARVCAQIAAWACCGDGNWEHVAGNIEREIALSTQDFSALLQAFVTALGAGAPPESAWCMACRSHHFRGAVVPPDRRPAVLGRAIRIEQYADFIVRAPGSEFVDRGEAKQFLRIHAGSPRLPSRKVRALHRAKLGNYVLWATFNPSDGAKDPFLALPRTTGAVRTALGLGHIQEHEKLVLVAYRSDIPTPFPLHRPTVADAGSHPYYRPNPDLEHHHGWTRPLDPNPEGLDRHPEVVHPEIVGLGLLLPFHVT